MSPGFSLGQLICTLGGVPQNLPWDSLGRPVGAISTDSRHLNPGDGFVALRGETWDGHQFVAGAIERGAGVAIVDHQANLPDTLPLIRVADTLTAYQTLGQAWRRRFAIPVIAVTGSAGKTTMKELLAAVLGTQGRVLKTQENENNDIGVPKTLLQLRPDHAFAVIEMGMRARGEIQRLARLAQPTVGVITNTGTAHIGRLGSREAIAQAKCELFAHLGWGDIAVYNWDSPLLRQLAPQVTAGRTLSYGLTGGDVVGTVTATDLRVGDWILPLPLPGEHNAVNYLGALGVAQTLGVDWTPLTQGLPVELPAGRSRRLTVGDSITLLDETYNASPEAVIAALKLLKSTAGRRRIPVLGAMRELGDSAVSLHQQVGEQVAALAFDQVVVLGDDPEVVALAAAAHPVPTERFTDPAALTAYLVATLEPGDTLLFKASRSIGLDRIVTQVKKTLEAREPATD
ncbi:MAG: UDP-N-acetylmuramoyl-tripeptide--D-alanyl-D-alanine ligase [Gloeomargaritaceae cyanobacterium C42_A2020_066]|nr:UDP-N-acetylmuramoyl-tripeptide--D-alanyl-D-alanine ligase [Gloeomargaritaceae cyanobacterium C42_A2020_066]